MKKLNNVITWRSLTKFTVICSIISIMLASIWVVCLWWDEIRSWIDDKVSSVRNKFKR